MKLFFNLSCFIILLVCNNYAQDRFAAPFQKEINITDKKEFLIRSYLVEKYNPGNCYGMPSPTLFPEREVNIELVVRIKEKFNLTHDDEAKSIARKMIRFRLEKTSENEYYFQFTDGRCCIITTYKGIITIVNNKVLEEMLEKKIEEVPC